MGSGCMPTRRLSRTGPSTPPDAGPVAAALREAAEEIGLDPGGVEVVGAVPEAFIPPTPAPG
jgi:8-oxo-dGTP pyrophosphatase MutT (NUDIX family)